MPNSQKWNNISTHTPLAGRDKNEIVHFIALIISTHTPLAGRDLDNLKLGYGGTNFYSHAPRGARLFELLDLLEI